MKDLRERALNGAAERKVLQLSLQEECSDGMLHPHDRLPRLSDLEDVVFVDRLQVPGAGGRNRYVRVWRRFLVRRQLRILGGEPSATAESSARADSGLPP